MKYIGLVLKSARRSKRRTLLTIMSVAIAVFLFASLRAVLDGFNAAAEASSSTRIVTQRATSLFFSMPSSHAETIKSTPGVEALTWANWFGGVYKDPQNFFAQFAVDPESYLRLYPEVELTPEERTAFLQDRTGCIVGDGLAKRFGFKVGDKITLQVGIPVYGTRDFDFNQPPRHPVILPVHPTTTLTGTPAPATSLDPAVAAAEGGLDGEAEEVQRGSRRARA